jgi:type IV pilus assembly protein PilM
MLGKKNKSVVGLDIGSSSLKAVELKPTRSGFELLHISHQNLQSDTIVDGHIIDLNHVSDSINRVWTEQGVKTNQVATSLSGHAVIVKKITLPAMPEEELDEQIHWEAEQYIPFDINDVNLYHEVSGYDPSGQTMEVLLVACKRDKIAQFTQVISQAGKQPVIVDVDAFALQNAYVFNYHPMPNQTTVLLDIGASVMTINVVRGTTSIFTRDISAGGNQFTDLLQKELNLTFEQAETLKRTWRGNSPVSNPNFGDDPLMGGGGNLEEQAGPAIQSVSEMLAMEIQRTLDFFRATASDSSAIDRMLIAGGSSKVAYLCEYLSDKFQIPVERFDSFRSIKFDHRRFDEEYMRELSPNMAVAVGLAARVLEVSDGPRTGMVRVNLLEGTAEQRVSNQKTKVAARRGQQLFMLAAALLIFAIVVGADYFLTNNAHADASEQLEVEKEEFKKLQADIDRKNQLESELKQVEDRIKVVKQLRAEQKGPVALLSAINERMPGGQADFRLASITQKGSRLQIIGSSSNQQVIADFARQLEFSNGLFTNLRIDRIEGTDVKPEGADSKEDTETVRVFQFTISCDYNKPRAEGDQAAAPSPQQGK